MSSPMRWWVATFDMPEGERAQLTHVAQADCEGLSTLQRVYVKARTKSEATDRARYVRKRMVSDANERANRDKGLCRCGSPLDRGINPNNGNPYAKCSRCQGAVMPQVPSQSTAPVVPIAERKDERIRPGDSPRVIQHKLLKQIQFEWETCPNNGYFTRYLKQLVKRTAGEG